MTPEEIAQKVVDEWWEISGTLRGAIASAIRAERERAEKAETERDRLRAERDSLMMRVNHGTPKDACYSTDDDPNCPLEHLWITRNGDLRAERDRLREALGSLVERNCTYDGPNIVIPIGSHGHAIEAMRVARAALARAKGESNEPL